MEEQKHKNCLSMPEHDLTMNEDEKTITYISFPIYQVHTVDPIIFCVDTDAPHSWIGYKALESIVRHSGRGSIPMIDPKRDFIFDDTLVRSRGMVELMLRTPWSTLDIPVILDVLDVEIPVLLVLDILDGNNVPVDNVTDHLWNRLITNKDPLRFENIWKIKLIRKGEHQYVLLSTPIQLFYSMEQLRKLHKKFAHSSASYMTCWNCLKRKP